MADITEIKQQLNARIESLCATLLPNGKRSGAEWCVGSTNGEAGQSTRVHLSGDKAGVWCDFAGSERGDALDLICSVRGLRLADAINWAKDWLGILEPSFYQPAPPKVYRKPERRKDVRTPLNGVAEYLTGQRGLAPEMLKLFKIGEIESREFQARGGAKHVCPAIVFPSLVDADLCFVKYLGVERPSGDKLTDVEGGCEPVLFGWQTSDGAEREVIICEGEINAMSWRQLGFFALATPFGAGKGGKHNWVDREWERLARFETVYLDFDQDEPGRQAVVELSQRLGFHRCRIVPPKPDVKDVNDWMKAGCDVASVRALLERSSSCDPQELRSAVDFTEDVIAEFYSDDPEVKGLAPGFKGLQGQFAWRVGEVTLVTGFSGHGKTQAVNLDILKLCKIGERACIASFEMKGRKTLKRMVRQATGQKWPSESYIRYVMEWTRNRLWIFDRVGSAKIERILEVFEYALRRYGIRWFVIDSMTKCGIAEDDYNGQKRFIDLIVNFANIHNVGVVVIAHTRKQDDESDPPGKFDVRGHSSITDLIHNGMSYWRNKSKEIAVQVLEQTEEKQKAQVAERLQAKLSEPDALLIFWKIREAEDKEPRLPLFFDPQSLQFSDDALELRKPIVPFVVGAQAEEEEIIF